MIPLVICDLHRGSEYGRRAGLVARNRNAAGGLRQPIIAVANSFTQFVPGHVHLKDMGQLVISAIEEAKVFIKSSTPSLWTTVLPWVTAACSTPCRRAKSSPTPWSTW